MPDVQKAMDAIRRHWNECVPVHARSHFYDVDGFKGGKSSLCSIELEELGDVAGKSMLHLQCHFGLDTMSWARLGAKVTGVDFSEEAIDLARALSRELDIGARFVLSNVYDLSDALDERAAYDIVFTSYGVLCWLPDTGTWARVAAHFLRPGGTFYIVDGHPFGGIFDDSDGVTKLKVVDYPYFHSAQPMWFGPGPSYAGDELLKTPTYEWVHPISDILNSLISAGLRIEFLHEFPFTPWQAYPMMERGEDGWWRLPDHQESVPLLFSLKATKPI
ncbi:MAG: class I SAM-dependent methyltransferase [Chloroflexi bacterium]|nr:class I SAM-dependent methyltransferase [Chloroflexota bacterium]